MKSLLGKLSSIEERGRKHIAAEKKQGKALVVFSSTFVPEEIIRAVGANTYLLCKGGDAKPADAMLDYTSDCINPLARASVGYILGNFDDLSSSADLVVTAFSDGHMGRMSELLEYKGYNVFKIGLPTDWLNPGSYDYYLNSLRKLVGRVEALCGNAVDWKLAREYFARSNRVKACFQRINALRRSDAVPICFEDIAKLHSISFMLNQQNIVELLENFTVELESAPPLFDSSEPRLMVIMRAVPAGDHTVFRLIDDSGCPVVAEVIDECACVSNSPVETEGDLIENFALSRYKNALPINGFQPSWMQRFARIKSMIEEYRVDGVIWYQLEHDEIYDLEYSCVQKWLGEMKIPVTKIETDYDYCQEKLVQKKNQLNSFIKRVKKTKR